MSIENDPFLAKVLLDEATFHFDAFFTFRTEKV